MSRGPEVRPRRRGHRAKRRGLPVGTGRDALPFITSASFMYIVKRKAVARRQSAGVGAWWGWTRPSSREREHPAVSCRVALHLV